MGHILASVGKSLPMDESLSDSSTLNHNVINNITIIRRVTFQSWTTRIQKYLMDYSRNS